MQIRKRLIYQFQAIVALILLLSSLTTYFSFSGTRRDDFFDRLVKKATMVAQMLIEYDEIDADLLKKIESNNPLSLPNEKIVIYDYQNRIIYSSDEDQILQITVKSIDEVRLNGDIRMKKGDYEIVGQFYASQYDRFVVFAAANDIFGKGKLKRLRIILFAVFVLCMVITYFSGRVFSTRALRPISAIMSQVEDIEVSNLEERVPEGRGNDEIDQLAKTFNRMLDRLELTFRNQKNFIANASHELRTPLTMITGQLEVILMKARSNEEYRKTIQSVLEDINNVNRISNRLLLLAQAGSDFSKEDFERVRIDEAIWKARNEVLKRHSQYRIEVHFSEEIDNESMLTAHGNELLLRTAIANLMDNGCKYSLDHSVQVHIGYDNSDLILLFEDKGIGIPDSEINLIFQPFYRATNALGIKGHGIGLSIVEKIITLHEGTLKVFSKEQKGTTISVRLHGSNS